MEEDFAPIETIAVDHANVSEDVQKLFQQIKGLFSLSSKPLSVDVALVLGEHVSPGAVDIGLFTREQSGIFWYTAVSYDMNANR